LHDDLLPFILAWGSKGSGDGHLKGSADGTMLDGLPALYRSLKE
jgi:hypothetical protein